MKHNTAILVASFGTMHMDTLERCITAAERAIAESFPECPVYRGFLNRTVIQSLREKQGIQTDSLEEALCRMEGEGYSRAVIQPTLLLRGLEYEKLTEAARKAENPVVIGRPLLENVSDCRVLAAVLMEENPLQEKEALVLMGHGTECEANEIYSVLQEVFTEKGYPGFIAAMEGRPSFADAAERLKQWGARQARLLPLMFVAGSHARKNMAGEKDSLLAAVRGTGITAEPVFRGLGESRGVQALYVERVREALAKLE